MSSAIEGETMSQVRKYLQKTHLMWTNRHNEDKFHLGATISDHKPYQMQQFCFDFVVGQHKKRRRRALKQ